VPPLRAQAFPLFAYAPPDGDGLGCKIAPNNYPSRSQTVPFIKLINLALLVWLVSREK